MYTHQYLLQILHLHLPVPDIFLQIYLRDILKRLLKKFKYPPEDMDFALDKVIAQCELWVDETA